MITTVRQFLTFGFVGLINTGIGLAVIYTLMLGVGVSPILSNLAGYAVGLCVSFVLNSGWTFQQRMSVMQALRFLGAFVVSYGANLLSLVALIGSVGLTPELAQLGAMCVYVCVFFILSRLFVFRNPESETARARIAS